MILTQDVVDRMESNLDAEGSDRYLFDQDYKPAINHAIDFLVATFNVTYGQTKLPEEDLRELVKVRVVQTNNYGRFTLNETDLGHKVWSVAAVMPNPETWNNTAIDPQNRDYVSLLLDDAYIKSENFAKRLTMEQWNKSKKNIFMEGNEIMGGELNRWAYLNWADYRAGNYQPGDAEIEVRSSESNSFIHVAVAYVKFPRRVTDISSLIEFPDTLMALLVDKALYFISRKQGDMTTMHSVTKEDSDRLVAAMG